MFRAFVFAMLLLPTLCVGQDYQTVRSDFVHFFESENEDYHGLKLDSIESVGLDSVFRNYAAARIIEYDYLEVNVPSWIGEKVIIKPSGENLLFNITGDTILIETQALLFDSWRLYKLSPNSFLEAEVTSVGVQGILDTTDEAKTIVLQAKDLQGQPIFHPLNGKVITISKSLGILRGFDFYHFPEDTTQIVLVGMENPNSGVHRLSNGDIYDFQIGDEFHYHQTANCNTAWYPYESKWMSRVIAVDDTSTLRTITFSNFRWKTQCIPGTNPLQLTTEILWDTVSNQYNILEFPSIAMPNEASVLFDTTSQNSCGQEGVSHFSDETFHLHESGRTSYSFDGSISCWFYNSTQSIWEREPWISESMTGGTTYTKGVGISSSWFHNWGGANVDQWSHTTLVYFKKGTEEWGEPYTVSAILGVGESMASDNLLYPNPVRIGRPVRLSIASNATVNLISIDGKQLPIELVNGTMKTDNLTSGIYLLRIETETGVSTQKLVVTN